MDFEIRPATNDDITACGDLFSLARVSGWRPGGLSIVAEAAGAVVGWGNRMSNPVHPTRDLAHVEVIPDCRRNGIGTALVRALQQSADTPLSAKATALVDGPAATAAEYQFLTSLGKHIYQRCPMVSVRPDNPHVQAWCAASLTSRVVPGTTVSEQEFVDACTSIYQWQHASWSPTADRTVVRADVAEWWAEHHPEHGFAVRLDGHIVALTDCYQEDYFGDGQVWVLGGEAVDPARPSARADVRSCIAASLQSLASQDREVTAEVHITDPHTWPVVASIPHVRHRGETELIEIRP